MECSGISGGDYSLLLRDFKSPDCPTDPHFNPALRTVVRTRDIITLTDDARAHTEQINNALYPRVDFMRRDESHWSRHIIFNRRVFKDV